MTIEERIISLLKSGDTELLLLGATLLNNVEEKEEQVRIFDLATNVHVKPIPNNPHKLFVSGRKIWYANPDTRAHTNIVGKYWTLFRNSEHLYLLSRPWGDYGRIIL